MRNRALLLAAAVVLVVSCARAGPGLDAVEPVDRPDVVPALRFRGPTLDGCTLELADLAGRPVVLWFWASSCTNCAQEAATVEVLHRLAEGDAEVVGVTCGSVEAARIFQAQHELSFPTLLDQDGTLSAALGVACQPAWAFVSPDGATEVVTRVLDLDELGTYLEAAGGAPVL
jgi:peroxiredoxin